MKLEKTLWHRTLILKDEFSRRGENLTRDKLQDVLQVSNVMARNLIFCIDNRDIINADTETIEYKHKKGIVFADSHIPFQDKLCLDSILDYADRYKPDFIIILGDLIDFYKISRFIKNPKKRNVKTEIKLTRDFLSDLRLRFPNSKIYYKSGNHEDRLEKYIIQNAPEIHELVEDLLTNQLTLDDLNIRYISKPFRMGKLWFLHGHEKPGGSYNPEYICNVMWKYIYSHFLVAHFHRQQKKIFKNIEKETFWTGAVGYTAGVLEYAILNQWTQGFCTLQFDSKGQFKAQLRDIHDGVIY